MTQADTCFSAGGFSLDFFASPFAVVAVATEVMAATLDDLHTFSDDEAMTGQAVPLHAVDTTALPISPKSLLVIDCAYCLS